MPEYDGLQYKLEFTRQGETEPALTQTVATASAEQDLEPGVVYTLKVTAYRTDPAVLLAEGSVPGITAQAGQSVPVMVTLTPYKADTGTLNYAVTLSGEMTLAGGSLTLYPLSGSAAPTYIDLNAGPGGVKTIPSGYYRVQFSVYGSTGGVIKFAAKTGVLHINDSLTTTALYTLAAGDFTDTDLIGDKVYRAENPAQLESAFNSIRGASQTVFTILVSEDFSSPPISLTDAGYDGKTIILRGSGGIREISLFSQGSLFTIGYYSVEPVFKLRDITLKGRTDNNTALLLLINGELIMESGATVTGNNTRGVSVSDGNFTMRDNASVSGNTFGGYGGGVYVSGSNGNFTMQDNALVNGNTAMYGGGVCVDYGSFSMEGNALVSGNTATNNNGTAYGGGVYKKRGNFTMQGNASVSGNTVSASSAGRGGGV
jgi:hypothetical protein